MSVAPDTPEDWITVKIQGRKSDIGPDATVEDLFETVRHMIGSKALNVPGGTAARHTYTARDYAIVAKSTVGTKANGDWETPDSKEDIVPYDLDGVEEGEEMRLFNASSWDHPIYPEAVDE